MDDDRHLASRIVQSDEEAVEILDRAHRRDLESLARRAGLSFEDSKEAVQDALFGAVVSIQKGKFRGQSSLRTFLISILRNKIADHYRRRSRTGLLVGAGDSDTDEESLIDVEDLAGPPVRPDIKLMTEKALAAMPEEHQLILVLNQKGYTSKEISRALGRSHGRVAAMLAEAKKMLRTNLRGKEE